MFWCFFLSQPQFSWLFSVWCLLLFAAGAVIPDEDLVSQLMAMGFQENGCRRAAVAVNNASAGEDDFFHSVSAAA